MKTDFVVTAQEWDRRFMRLAREAAGWSKDPDEQVGSVLVSPDRRHFSFGYNGLPHGMFDDPEILCNKDLKNALTIHAEQNALYNSTCNLEGWTIYVTKPPCLGCALGIRQNRIARVVSAPLRLDSRWLNEHKEAIKLLEGLNIPVNFVSLETLDA